MTTSQQYQRIHMSQLVEFSRPFVEVGYDAFQIGDELNKQSIVNCTDDMVQQAINIIMAGN